MDSLPNLVSPFGGLRDNHFHSGMDLRTNGREGLPVYAAADGYISRIKIQRNGYGKALYIEHPNGYATVYGHLQQYHGPIADWIHRYQYINKTFEFDKIFMKPFLKVKKGDTIGWSGNSGASTGPHLHFEIRDSKTEKILNPALFGLIPFDTLNPFIRKLHVYKFVAEGLLLKKQISVQTKNCYLKDSIWIWKDTLIVDADIYGFGIEAYDFIHNTKDEKGIYEYSLSLDNKSKFSHVLNQFAFDESKYINAHIDFPYYKIEGNRIQKCFVDDGNLFSTYTSDADKGRLNFVNKESTSGELLFVVKDANKNGYYLKFYYRVVPLKPDPDRLAYEKSSMGKQALYPGKAHSVQADGLLIKMDPKSIYDTIYYTLETVFGQKGTFSKEYAFHTPNLPIHTSFDISIVPDNFPQGFENKLLLAYTNGKSDNLRSVGGVYEKGVVHGKGSNFGNYCVTMDTIAPTIKWKLIKNEENSADTMRWDFEIKDNFSGIGNIQATLNDNWILMDYDPKNQLLTYRFDEVYYLLKQSLNIGNDLNLPVFGQLKLVVEDAKQNKQEKIFNLLLK